MALPQRSLSFLDVGHGNCAILQQPSGTVIFDAGSGNSVLEFLEKEKISKVDYVIISHSDEDHLSGLLALFGVQIPIGCVYVNPDGKKHTTLWKDVAYYLQDLQKAGKTQVLPISAQTLTNNILGPVKLEIVAPGTAMFLLGTGNKTRSGESITTNTNSVVVRILDSDDPVALLTGDLDGVALADIEERGVPIKAKYLLFPHHGGKSGRKSLLDFAEKLGNLVSPDYTLFSIGRNRYDNPKEDALTGLRKARPSVHFSCTQLSATCGKIDLNTSPSHLFETYSRGSETGECCAGTMVVDLDDHTDGHVKKEAHVVFVKERVISPMCVL